MKQLLTITALFISAVSFSQNEISNELTNYLNLVIVKRNHHVDAFKQLKAQGINVSDSLKNVAITELTTPQVQGSTNRRFDHNEFFNNIKGSKELNGISQKIKFDFSLRTNHRTGNDLQTNIDTLANMDITLTLVDQSTTGNKNSKKEMTKIFKIIKSQFDDLHKHKVRTYTEKDNDEYSYDKDIHVKYAQWGNRYPRNRYTVLELIDSSKTGQYSIKIETHNY